MSNNILQNLTEIEDNFKSLSKISQECIPKDIYNFIKKIKELELEKQKNALDENSIKIAMVGAYSSGKSSFLNRLLGKDLTETGINQTTRCLTNITYGEKPIIKDLNTGEIFSENEYKEFSKKEKSSGECQHYIIEIPDERLKGIVLIDSPGFTAPKSGSVKDGGMQDSDISKKAADDADVCFFLIPINDGCIKEENLKYIKKLNERTNKESDKPLRLFIILNQADAKPPKARDAVLEQVKEDCDDNKIIIESIFCHTSISEKDKKFEKTKDFFAKCQKQVWDILKILQEEKEKIVALRRKYRVTETKKIATELLDTLFNFKQFQVNFLQDKMKSVNKKLGRQIEDTIKDFASKIAEITTCFVKNNGPYSYVDNPGFFSSCVVRFYSGGFLPGESDSAEIKKSIYEELDKYNLKNKSLIIEIIEKLFVEIITFITNIYEPYKYFKEETFFEDDAKKIRARKDNSYINAIYNEAPDYFYEIVSNTLGEILMNKFYNESENKKNVDDDLSILVKLSASAEKLKLSLGSNN